jgi:pimeloyl-ACP methyl ester carboxylesterase
MNAFKVAEIWHKLMTELGYSRFGAQGGDIGAGVSTCLGVLYPENVTGLHLNYIPGSYKPYLGPGSAKLSETEKQFLVDVDQWYQDEGGYAHIQRTRPQTLAYGLQDSPVGLAAWIVEKFRGWSDCGGDVERRFTKDELLTNVMIYWLTGTFPSSTRYYYEGRLRPLQFGEGERMKVPCGIIRFKFEAPFPPREWVERFYRVERWNEVSHGGHFAAMEEPQALAEGIRAFFRQLR